MPAWTNSRATRLHRLQAGQPVSRQRRAQQAHGAGLLRADVRRHRRDAGGAGRRRADRLAHGVRLGAGGALSRPRATPRISSWSARARSRRIWCAPIARCGRSRGDALEPDPLARGRRPRSRSRRPALTPEIADDLEEAVRDADIVSCATLSAVPLIRGAWLKKGAHLDLVGAFSPKTREADDAAVKRARVYVDSRATAPKGSGDIAIPLKKKVIAAKDIQGDLFELCRGTAKGRSARTRSRCSSRPGSRWRTWRPPCWSGTR